MHKRWTWVPLALAAGGMWGCAGEAEREGDLALAAPAPMAPLGAPEGESATPPLPPIDLSEENVAAWTRAEPTIIDTRRFPVQVVDTSGDGSRTTGHIVPPHERPKVHREGPANDLRASWNSGRKTASMGVAFEGIGMTGWTPPDPTLAVGPTHVVSTVNMAIAFHDREGNLEFQSHLGSPGDPGFFEPVGAEDFTFDPKCVYHPGIERFIVLALEVYQNRGESWITIAISDDSDPNGVWYKYRTWSVVQIGGTTYWVDYPGLGFDDHGVYVTGNLFRLSGGGGGFGGAVYRSFDLQKMMNGEPIEFADVRSGSSSSVQATTCYGSPAAPYFTSLASSTRLRLEALTNPLTNPQVVSVEIPIPSWGWPNDAPNGGGSRISTLDGRIMNGDWRDGRLVTGHGIGVSGNGTRSVARWYEIDTQQWPISGTPTLVQSGNVQEDNSHWTFFPALALNERGEIGMIMAGSRSGEFAAIAATSRAADDPAGEMGAPTSLLVGNTEASGRWGDYFDLTTDPVDGRTFWGAGQVQTPSGWQTWIVSFTSGCDADLNGDGEANVDDFFLFLDLFAAGDPQADINGDGELDVNDLFAFLDVFAQGC